MLCLEFSNLLEKVSVEFSRIQAFDKLPQFRVRFRFGILLININLFFFRFHNKTALKRFCLLD